MKDDSLSDVQKHGLEIARKIDAQNNLNRHYCSMCDSVVGLLHICTQFPFADPVNVGNYQGPVKIARDSVLYAKIWNEAIEAAALIVQPQPHVDEERKCEDIASEIRKLKK